MEYLNYLSVIIYVFWVSRFIEGYRVSPQLKCWILVLARVQLSGEKLINYRPIWLSAYCMLVHCYLFLSEFSDNLNKML
jgi:hypothetical protein